MGVLMLHVFGWVLAIGFLSQFPTRASAQDVQLDFPIVETCPVLDAAVEAEVLPSWTPCERWIWSCIRAGFEANLHAKRCTKARRDADDPNYRTPYQFAAFYDPDRFASANAVSDEFLRTLLSNPAF